MRIFLRLGAVALAVALTAVPVRGATARAEPADLIGRVDAAVAAKLAEMGVPGAIVGLSIPGEVDYLSAIGVGDTATGQPMSVDDHWRVGSVTKTFTGTAVLQLVDQGRISLSDPISRYVDGVPFGDQITLDLLGRMRSGLFNYAEDENAFLSRVYAESPIGPDAFAFTPRDLLDIAFSHPLNFAPGTDYEYSNTNTVLLGLVVEKVTGLALGDYFAQNLYPSVGLTQTSYPSNGLMPEPYSHGYTPLPSGGTVDATLWNPSWGDAAGRVVSNYADTRAWAESVGRGTLLSPATQAVRLQTAEVIPGGVGYGFAVFDANGWIGHNGDIPGYTTVAAYLPERDATLVVFTNSDAPPEHAAGQLATAVTEILLPDHVYRLGPASPESLPEADEN